jgi:vacuolar iron transporter family protein
MLEGQSVQAIRKIGHDADKNLKTGAGQCDAVEPIQWRLIPTLSGLRTRGMRKTEEMEMRKHSERHYAERIGWLRAAVLGANDGIVSTASLVVGVAAAEAARGEVLVAGMAGLVAGAMSMAAGEYVSVSSQADTERADLARERYEIENDAEFEQQELAEIYVTRGLDPSLAQQVAGQLMAHDALSAHARDELGISEMNSARPIQASLASAGTFAVGAALPLAIAWIGPATFLVPAVAGGSLLFLALLGGLAARAGGAKVAIGAGRVTFWGAVAMAVTAVVGKIFGTVL